MCSRTGEKSQILLFVGLLVVTMEMQEQPPLSAIVETLAHRFPLSWQSLRC